MDLRPHEYPQRMELLALIDAACSDCFWKRRFNLQWADHGLQFAWESWLREAPIVNESYVPLARAKVEELLEWVSSLSS